VLLAFVLAAPQNLPAQQVKVVKPDPAVIAADAERAKLLTETPKSTADYTLAADQAQIGWEGMTTFAVVKDYFGPGANSLHLERPDFGKGVYAYWKLKGIQPGKYYLGLWAQTNDTNYRTEYSPNNLLHTCFINGWVTRFASTSDPVQVKAGVWLAELQGKEAVELKNGDEIALAPAWGNNQFLRLCLYSKEPVRGHGVTGQSWGIREGMTQQVQLSTKLEILGKPVEGEDMEARITIANPLPYDAEVDADVCLADYFGKPLRKETLTLKIESHKVLVKTYKFKSAGADRAYQLDLKTHPPKDTAQPRRPIEMVEMSDFTHLAYLPSRPGPLEVWSHERFDVFEIHTGIHKALPLDGSDWQIAPLTTKRVPKTLPEKLDYKPTYVPYRNNTKLTEGVYGQWFRKTFKVPAWMKGERYILDFTKIVVEGTLFVNGKRIATKREGSALPLVVDVTDSLKLDGDNEVVLCVRDAIGVVSEEFVDQFNSTTTTEADCDTNADFLTNTRLFVSLESVFLRTAPAVRVNQVVVLPKVDQGKLKLLARIENTTREAKEVELGLSVQQFGKEVETALPETKVHLDAGQVKEVPLESTVKGLVEYTPRNPALARLEVFILGNASPADAAKTAHEKMKVMADLDNYVQRFGYRQLRVEGTQFTWNGHPKRMLSAFQHWPVAMYERQEGIEGSRDYEITGPWIPLDLYDEIGKMAYPYLDGTGAMGWKWLNNNRVQESGRRVGVEMAWLTGWHPCVIGYDMANESFHYDPYVSGVEGQAKHGDLLAQIAKTVHDKVDPDLWIFSDGDESLGGRINFCSFHYLNQGMQGNWGRSDGNGINDPFHGCFHHSPDCFYINGAALEPKLGTMLFQNPDWKYGSCACGETETFWFFDGQDGIFPASYLGDKCAVSSNYQFYTARGMAWAKMSLDAYRDMDQTLIAGIYWRPFLATGVQHVTFIMPQQEVRYYSGATFDRRLDVVDDEFQPGRVVFTWQLRDENDRRVDGRQLSGISTTKFLYRDRVKFDIPRVDKRTQFTLSMALTKDGVLRACEDRLVEVWPAPEKVKALATVPAVFDPKHGIDYALKQLGCPFKTILTLDPKTLAEYTSLIVGPMAIEDTMTAQGQAVRNFAGAGGRVILLEQASMLALPADTYVEQQGTFTQAFVTKSAAGHPVTAGLTDADFQMWNFTGPHGNAIHSHIISERIYRRPARGNFMTLVEAGHGGGLQWTPLMEVYIGKGSILATQLPLTSRWTTEPMAVEMLVRMIAYLDMPVYRLPQASLAIVGGASEAVKNRLAEIRTSLKDKPDQGDVALLDMTIKRPEGESSAAEYAQWVKDGGTLIVHRTKPQDASTLTTLVGKPVRITVEPYQSWEDRQMLDQPDSPLLAGLNNVDFYWRSHIVSEAPDGCEQISNGVPAKHRFGTEYVVYVDGARDLLFPGGLVEVQVGKGRVIIDQLNWEMSDTDIVGGSPQRVISMLLTNLGVVQRPPNPKPALPAGVTYETLDISKLANTSMVDDKAGGVNDWCSWGPDADIRDMPSGKVTFTGTPFDVPSGKLNAICIRTNWIEYLKKFPDSVTVPVGKDKVAGIWLLHTGGWSGGKASFGRREIWYSDGTKEVIDMNETDMGDWNYGRDQFPDEEYTTTTVAWKGSCKQYNVTRVYKTLWVNPQPQKTIDKIVITNAGLEPDQWRFVPHLGITLAMLPTGGGLATGDAAKASALIAEATKLLDAKDTKGATAKLDAALVADPANAGAWQLLTSLRSKTDDPKTFTALCQKWMAADPKNPKPYNILAAYLEDKGQKEEALRLYKQSLQIEWNQPPAGEAVRRLEQELKK
jgi:hypothetical protein